VPVFRYVSWREYGELAEALAEKVRGSGKRFDLVIGLARGGIPVSMVVSDRLGAESDILMVRSYDGIAKRGRPRITSGVAAKVRGRRVLIVDDLVDEGKTLAEVKRYLAREGPALLEAAVVFRKPWSKTEPEYYVESTEAWIVSPFEVEEVRRLREVPPKRSTSAEKR
jgi:uncharacterized protein